MPEKGLMWEQLLRHFEVHLDSTMLGLFLFMASFRRRKSAPSRRRDALKRGPRWKIRYPVR